MSMTFYCYREDAGRPVGSLGPLTEDDDLYHFGEERRLDATPEQEEAAGWFHGPNVSNSNAAMILRSLGYEEDTGEGAVVLDPAELLRRVTLARVVPPIADDGQPDIVSCGARGATFVDCGVRPGYFTDRYAGIADVAEKALAWGVEVVLA